MSGSAGTKRMRDAEITMEAESPAHTLARAHTHTDGSAPATAAAAAAAPAGSAPSPQGPSAAMPSSKGASKAARQAALASARPVATLRGRCVYTPSDRGFNMGAHRMRHVALHVAYLGHEYHGFAAQEGPSHLADGTASARDAAATKRARMSDAAHTHTHTHTATHGAAAHADEGGKSSEDNARGKAPKKESSTAAGDRAASELETIESVFFAALLQACFIESRESCGYTRCGRTDRGVSAGGQIMAMRLRSKAARVPRAAAEGHAITAEEGASAEPPFFAAWARTDGLGNEGAPFPPPDAEHDYPTILNSLLPPDIRVLGWADVDDTFSARFSATSRTYRYYFVARPELDIAKMADAARRMVGVHDFRNLCKFDVANASNFVREIVSARILRASDESAAADAFVRRAHVKRSTDAASPEPVLAIDGAVSPNEILFAEIVGRAFLWHQIRAIMAILFHVGRGLEEPDVVDQLLDVAAHPRRPNYTLANDAPLILFHCGFGEEGLSGGSMLERADELPGADEAVEGGDAAWSRPARFTLEDAGLYGRMYHSPQALRGITEALEQQWTALALKAAMIRGLLDRVNALPVQAGPDADSREASAVAARGTTGSAVPPARVPWGTVMHTHAAPGKRPLSLAECDYAARGPASEYKPLFQRKTGPSVSERWNALTDAQRAEIARLHPTNAVRLATLAATEVASTAHGTK